jgi:hypothetical protein
MVSTVMFGFFVIWYQLLRYLALKLMGNQERKVGDILCKISASGCVEIPIPM